MLIVIMLIKIRLNYINFKILMFTYMYATSPTASRKTTALIRNGALPLSSNHSAFPNSSPQTGSGSSFSVFKP